MKDIDISIIDPEEVNKVFLDCLFKDNELENGKPKDVDFIPAIGIVIKVGFHPKRLESYRDIVNKWLGLLPKGFRNDSGGGWSFLNMCNQEDGTLWTGLQQRMEQLMLLGMGLKLMDYVLPDREMWKVLPCGMPYIVIK